MSCPISARAIASIDLDACLQNAQLAKSLHQGKKKIIAVVKANAYGLGVLAIVKKLLSEVDYFAVATPDEAEQLRKNFPAINILVLGALTTEEREFLIKNQIDFFVSNSAEILEVQRLAEKLATKARPHLKIDTGMGRLGLPDSDIVKLLNELSGIKKVQFQGLASHLGTVLIESKTAQDVPEIMRFRKVLEHLKAFNFPMIHLLNSMGILSELQAGDNYLRPGLMLYGVAPIINKHCVLPVLKLQSYVANIKTLPANSPISYGGKSILKRDSKIAIVPIGYADGYPRQLKPEAHVLIHGQACPILGVVTMDMLMVDVSDLSQLSLGDIVTLIGTDANKNISIETLADWAQLIPWQILTGLGPRVNRVYINENHEN